jgi:hypothetical protein
MGIRNLDKGRLPSVNSDAESSWLGMDWDLLKWCGDRNLPRGARSSHPGGSEHVMIDLAIRHLVKNFQRKTKELESAMERPAGSSKL